MPKIKKVKAREILDSRGNPTLKTTIILDNNIWAKASVPSGASTGANEALELRDNDPKRYLGKGVLKAAYNVENEIGPKIIGLDPYEQEKIDRVMIEADGTKNKKNLGANSILSCSIAVLKAAAQNENQHLFEYCRRKAQETGLKLPEEEKIPIPVLNLINGGKHGAGNLEFQEFHIIPWGIKEYHEQLRAATEVYHQVEAILEENQAIHSVGDEGGFAPNLFTNLDAIEVVVRAINKAGYLLHKDIYLGLDVAADFFYKNNRYKIRDRTAPMETNALVDYYRDLRNQYPLLLLEDPLYEEDFKGWAQLAASFANDQTILVGDDLLCTNIERVEKAISEKSCQAVLIKPNQVGTISETLAVIKRAREADWQIIVSHRSGETNDTFIADFAVGVGADFAKLGAPARGERVAKYNRLLEIEEIITR